MESLQFYVKKKEGRLQSFIRDQIHCYSCWGKGENDWGGRHPKWSHEILITRFISERKILSPFLSCLARFLFPPAHSVSSTDTRVISIQQVTTEQQYLTINIRPLTQIKDNRSAPKCQYGRSFGSQEAADTKICTTHWAIPPQSRL